VASRINTVTSAHAPASVETAMRSATPGMGAGTPRSLMMSTRTGTAVTLSATPTNSHTCSGLWSGPMSLCAKGKAAAAQTTTGISTQGTSCQSGDFSDVLL
jgi:hypothetical protein